MEKLEVFIVNLFMKGETFSTVETGRSIKNITHITCDNFIFEFKQHNINLKQKDYENKTIITTTITIQNIVSKQVAEILGIIDNLCWLLSFAQQSPVSRCGYKIGLVEHRENCSTITTNSPANIIENRGEKIRNFIEQTYPTFKSLKSSRQLTVVFGYLCEAHRCLALEASLILQYVLIENLKNTFALEQGYTFKKGKYKHTLHADCSSTEMTKRMFDAIGIDRNSMAIRNSLNRRNKMIHEGRACK